MTSPTPTVQAADLLRVIAECARKASVRDVTRQARDALESLAFELELRTTAPFLCTMPNCDCPVGADNGSPQPPRFCKYLNNSASPPRGGDGAGEEKQS